MCFHRFKHNNTQAKIADLKWLNISKLTEYKTKRNITPVKVTAVSYSLVLVLQLLGYTDILLNLD